MAAFPKAVERSLNPSLVRTMTPGRIRARRNLDLVEVVER
jgi:hypothetical protein